MQKYQLWYNQNTKTYAMLYGKRLNEPLIARTSELIHEFQAESLRQAGVISSRATAAHKQRIANRKKFA